MMAASSNSTSVHWLLHRGPGTRNPAVSGPRRPRIQMAVIFLTLAFLISAATAISIDHPPQPVETLRIDTRIPVLEKGHWLMMSQDEHRDYLQRRQDLGSVMTTTATDAATTTIAIEVSSVTAQATTTTVVSSPLPSPFDGALSSNFSDGSTCPSFLKGFLASSTFKSCYAFSMLVQGSTSMFQAEKSLVTITQVLDATCAANSTFCVNYLDSLATNLTDSANCGSEYSDENSVVVQAYEGLRAYQPLYSAGCLRDKDTSSYCFADAITNSSAIADTYLYYLPLNMSYPNGTVPTCNTCSQQTLAIFQAATADRSSSIASTYAEAAAANDAACGSGFVNQTLPSAEVNSLGMTVRQTPPLLLLSFFVMLLTNWSL